MSGPLTSQSSLHLTSEFLVDLNSDLSILKDPPPKDVISPAFGQRYIPKLLRILAAEESTAEKKLKTLALFLTAIVDDARKSEVLQSPDKTVFLDLLSGSGEDIKTATCKAVKKLFDFTPTREYLYKSGIVEVLLKNVDSVPGPVAECFSGLVANRDIVSKLLEGEKELVVTLCKLLTSEDMKAREFSAQTLGCLSREDEGVRQVLANGIDDLLEGLKQNKSIVFKNGCVFTVMQLCRCYDGKVVVIKSSGVEALAECLQIQEEETQTLAMAALLGLSTELEAKERISNACTEDLMKLQYSPNPQLKSNTGNLIESISEFPAAKAKFKKTVLVIT